MNQNSKLINFRTALLKTVFIFSVSFFLFSFGVNAATIRDNVTGGDCNSVGIWDGNTKTCTLTADLNESIIISGNDITFDGNNYRITGGGYGITIAYWKNAVIKNLKIQNFTSGIFISHSENNFITNNIISDNSETGIVLVNSHGNVITENTISHNQISGLEISYAVPVSENKVYRNNFLNNGSQIYAMHDPDDFFYQNLPVGGNYWSNYDTPAKGCSDSNSDNFCDAPYLFQESSQDNYPWTKQNGWKIQANQPSALSNLNQLKSDSQTSISESGITTENTVIFQAAVSDADNDQVKLEIELRRIDEFSGSFTNTPTASSTFVASGSTTTIVVSSLANGQYHWQARAVDNQGNIGAWQEFRTAGNIDFEVKLVPLYTQVFSKYPSEEATLDWSDDPYARGADDNYDCGFTIGECGCAITSAVMLLRYHGITSAVDNQVVDPKNFNNWLNSNAGYVGRGNLNWPKIAEYSKFPNTNLARIHYDSRKDSQDTNTLNNYLRAFNPVIIKNSVYGHFLVADGILGNTYTIRDPAWYNTRKLDEERTDKTANIRDYNNYFDGLRLYTPTLAGGPIDGISLNLASPAEMLVIDPLGRKLGKDTITGIEYNEIPGGSYGSEGIGNADSEVPIVVHQTKNIWIPHTETGQYILQVIGTETGTYTLNSLIYDAQNNGHSQTLVGLTETKAVTNFNINVTPEQPEDIMVKPADKIPPEAKIYFDPENKELKIDGIDNITSPAPLITKTDDTFIIQDAADNTLTLLFKKLKQEKKEIKARLESLQYSNQPTIELPETKLHYEWSLDKNSGEIRELEQKIEVKHQFKIKAKYSSQTGEIKIRTTEIEIDDEKHKTITRQILSGMVIIKLITKSGVLSFEF